MAEISTTEFAAELDTDTRTARKFLRAITPKEDQPGKGSRWSIDGTKRSLNSMRKQFNEWSAAQEKKTEAPAEEVTDEVETNEMTVDEDLNLDD